MQLDIYRPKSHTTLYIFISAGMDPSLYLPHLIEQYGELLLVKSREVLPGQKIIGTSAEEILQNVERTGFHIQSSTTSTQVSEGGAAIGGGILGASIGGPAGAIVGALLGYAFAEHAKKVSDEL